MSEHARLSLSHTSTWITCAAWPRMVEGMGEEESPNIEFGNVSHDILESMLMGETPNTTVHAEEAACAQVAFDYVQQRWQEMDANLTECLAEAKVSCSSSGRDDLWGSADVILHNKDELEIVDLKSGAGTFVDEKFNSQLMAYAQAAVDTLVLNPTVIKLTIVQPRYWGSEPAIRTHEITRGELASWNVNTFLPAAAATDNPIADGTATVNCKHCTGRHVCEYRDRAVATALVADPLIQTAMEVSEMDIRSNQDAVIYDNERLSEVLMLVPVIRDYCDALEEHAKEIILKGEQVAGYKVIATGGRAKWLDEDAVTEALHGTRISKDAHKSTLKTPGQVLKLGPSAGLKKKLDGLIGKSSGGQKLVLESEKGDSIAPSFTAIKIADAEPAVALGFVKPIQETPAVIGKISDYIAAEGKAPEPVNIIETPAELPAFLL